MLRDHEEFRAMHNRLLASQVAWQHQHLMLEQSLKRIDRGLERLGIKGERHG
jgi:hypothetical protein